MADGTDPDGPGDGPQDADWLTIPEAARRLGVSTRTIRGRMVRLSGTDGPRDADGPPSADVWLLVELREELHEARLAIATAIAERHASEMIRTAEVNAIRELADRLTAELADARAELRRPW